MVWAVTSTACARMEGHVTESVGTVHVLVDGLEWPVNWVRDGPNILLYNCSI